MLLLCCPNAIVQAASASFQLFYEHEIKRPPEVGWKDLLMYFEVRSSEIKLIMRYLGFNLICVLVVLDGNFVISFLERSIPLR